jgi:hypothetical protein
MQHARSFDPFAGSQDQSGADAHASGEAPVQQSPTNNKLQLQRSTSDNYKLSKRKDCSQSEGGAGQDPGSAHKKRSKNGS